MNKVRYALADFQDSAVGALKDVISKISEYHSTNPQQQKVISLKSGVSLLQSPTGSGKTLILGRVLESLKGKLHRPTVWFWFAPYSGLVVQTRNSIVEQCGALRVRDISKDREVVGTRDGDVFVQTWGSVAANNKDSRKVRRTNESALSLDDLIITLREGGFYIGVVVDEAHLNFGESAKAAAKFYLKTLRPDFAILSTATPNDTKLEIFEKKVGIEVASRVVVPRLQVVRAGLNKIGLKVGVIRMSDEDRDLIDHEQATLTAGWTQHLRIKERLQDRGIKITPLMLVQVEDQTEGSEDPVNRVREKLLDLGVPSNKIACHTSGQPDPDFHTLAFDPEKEVLIFKVAVATGFDAPRAWTLVSVRPNRGKEFGLQIVGRIMRVHPFIRPIHGHDSLLDSGYVFLTDPEMQAGLDAATQEVKAVRQSIELITDRLDFFEFGNSPKKLITSTVSNETEKPPSVPVTQENRQMRLSALVKNGLLKENSFGLSEEEQDRMILAGEALRDMIQAPLFDNLPGVPRSSSSSTSTLTGPKKYPLLKDIGLPKALWRELPPSPDKLNDMVGDIAKLFCQDSDVILLLQKKRTKAMMKLKDLFLEGVEEDVDLRLQLSNLRIATKAQMAFNFNESIDPRLLKQALIAEMKEIVDHEGIEAEQSDLRRAIDLAVMKEPEKLKKAMKTVQGRNVQLSQTEPIPDEYFGPDTLEPAKKSVYGIFPDNMNQEEEQFAKLLDSDKTGTVLWWLRNTENARWATRMVLPSGKNFFPDFVVGIAGRATPYTIALVEIKDDGDTGRLHSDRNLDKIRIQHREYKNVFWTYRMDDKWVRARYDDGLHRILPKGRFLIEEMVFLQ